MCMECDKSPVTIFFFFDLFYNGHRVDLKNKIPIISDILLAGELII